MLDGAICSGSSQRNGRNVHLASDAMETNSTDPNQMNSHPAIIVQPLNLIAKWYRIELSILESS